MKIHSLKILFIAAIAVVLCLICAAELAFDRPGAEVIAPVEAKDPEAPLQSRLAFRVESAESGPAVSVRCVAMDDGTLCAFLPAFAEMDRVKVTLRTAAPLTLNGVPLVNDMDCSAFPLGEAMELTCEGLAAAPLTFMISGDVNALFVNTISGSMGTVHQDKYNREAVSLTLFDAEGRLEYQSRFTDEIRGRGQSSWYRRKKPYNLYLGDAADLLGMGRADKWALVASMTDECCLRNYMIYNFARAVGDYDGFAPECAFVDVFLNGKYHGLYLLCEKPEISPSRLDIRQDSWLFMMDLARRTGTIKDSFAFEGGLSLKIKSPSPCDDRQKEQLMAHLREFQEALLSEDGVSPVSGKAWNEYIDLDSFARKYLIDEVFENYDAGMASQYYNWNAEDGLLYAGPCWDYDGTLGIHTQKTPNCFLAQREWAAPDVYTPWYAALWRYPLFRDRVLELYESEFLPMVEQLLDTGIDEMAQSIATATALNRVRWQSFYDTSTFSGTLDFMKTFLREHIDFLNSAWFDGVDYRTVVFQLDHESNYQFFCLPAGSSCAALPSPAIYGLEPGAYWCLTDGTPFDMNTTLDENLFLVASSFFLPEAQP